MVTIKDATYKFVGELNAFSQSLIKLLLEYVPADEFELSEVTPPKRVSIQYITNRRSAYDINYSSERCA